MCVYVCQCGQFILLSALLVFILTPASFRIISFFSFVVTQQHKTEVALVKVRHNFPLCETSPARPKWLLLLASK